ncbi:hypothetical protein ABZW18_25820 [Streptomyces sp. NPDC004647]|uniref:ATP-grasp domain-containing protein n=1 Tax=Streptomyces sp. NPDC004647 TaxID=3154671 RepID=UPI0033BDC9B7
MRNSGRVSSVDILVQDVASFRIDPAVLARPDRRNILIVSPVNQERLAARGRCDVFDKIVTLRDFTADSVAAVVSALLEEGGHEPAQARLLCHDEYSLGIVARVREKLGIPGDQPASVTPFIDKLAMKAALIGHGIRMPRHIAWDSDAYRTAPDAYTEQVIDTVGLPAFVKPVNESGSVGTARIDSLEELQTWAAESSPGAEYEIDEYLRGELYHVDTAVQDGEIVYARVNQYLHPCHEYAAGRICSSFTLPEDDSHHARLIEFNRRVLDALSDKPRSSVYHHEIFLLPDGELVFLEIAARAPAARIPATGRIRWGLDIEEAHFQLQRGERIQALAGSGPFAAWVYFPKRAGRLTGIHTPEITSDHQWTWNVAIGETLPDSTDIRDFAASVLLWNGDYTALRDDLERLDQHTLLSTQ